MSASKSRKAARARIAAARAAGVDRDQAGIRSHSAVWQPGQSSALAPPPAPGAPPAPPLPPGLARKAAPAGRLPLAAEPVTAAEPPPEQPDDVPGWVGRALQEVLVPTFWLDPGEDGEPFEVTVSFSGRRVAEGSRPGPGDSFTREETFTGIVPGSGPVAVTAEVRGITPGEWEVAARAVSRPGGRLVRPSAPPAEQDGPGRRRDTGLRRLMIPPEPRTRARTALLPFAKIPGITRFVYPGLVSAGVLAGLALQSLLLAAAGLPWSAALLYSLYAVAAGLAGGKAWYVVTHRGRAFDGWCVQGFAAGAAVLGSAAPLAGLGIPAAAYYSTAAAGLLAGMGIGRPGCFWAGCCVGRPVTWRWGIWSSDRRVGCRRVPVQFMEALLALAAAASVVVATWLLGPARSGPAAVMGLAAYTLGRQFLLGLRADPPRRTPRGGQLTAAAAAVALTASIAALAAGT